MHSKSGKGNTGVKKRLPRITVRWITSVFGVIVLILVGFELTISAVIFSYYHKTVENYLTQKAEEMILNYNLNLQQNNYTYLTYTWAADYFKDQNLMELQILTPEGECLYTSIGYAIGQDGASASSDFLTALGTGNTGVYNGRNPGTNERIMAASVPILDVNGDTVGVLRLLTSLEAVNSHVWVLVFTTMAICLGIILFVFTTNYYFIGGIVSPLQRITETANRIAKGDMSARIDNQYRDEVGDLCDSINNMAAELAENDKMKNDFISSISHELRTPLTAIKGWSETMALCDPVSDRSTVMRGLSVVNDEVERLSHMVEELLDFSRIQSGRMRVKMDNVDLYAEEEQVILIMRERAAKARIALQFNVPEDINIVVLGDADRLNQVFINILDNAIKHSSEDTTIKISIVETATHAAVCIEDAGEGIPADELPHIKEKFFKGTSSKRGTGLGLAVADEIVRLHGGTLVIESELGRGTKVTIVLPKKAPPAPEEEAE